MDEGARGHRVGYVVVLLGVALFIASCFLPYYGGGSLGAGSETVSLYQQVSLGSDSVAWDLGTLLFLFGGVASVAAVAIASVTQNASLARTPAVLTAAVVAWSLTWIGALLREATFGLGITLEWGFWTQAASVGVVVVGTIVAFMTARRGADERGAMADR